MGNLELARIIVLICNAYSFLIFIRVLLSWFPNVNMYTEPVKTIVKVTDWILEPIRDLLERFGLLTVIDISPILAVFLLRGVCNLLLRLLVG